MKKNKNQKPQNKTGHGFKRNTKKNCKVSFK